MSGSGKLQQLTDKMGLPWSSFPIQALKLLLNM